MTLPGLRDWVFSAKTFASAMLALYIAFAMNLDRPYWAMATAFMVSQPLTGATRSKGIYRFAGTLLGATAAVVLVPNLAEAPVLLSGALALWTGVCLFFALLDRTPRSYVFMLAGYTAAIIGFASVDTPGAMFQTALIRVEEITLGIVCSTVIGTIVFPRPVGPVLIARMDAWFADARTWACSALRGAADNDAVWAARRAMAAASVEVGLLVSFLAYDTSQMQSATRPVAVLQHRMMFLLPVIFGVADRIDALRQSGGLTSETEALMRRLAAWIEAGADARPEEAVALREALARAEPVIDGRSGWDAVMRTSLLARMTELTEIVQDIRALRGQILMAAPTLPPLAFPRGFTPDSTRYRDYGMAVLSAFAAFLGVGLVCAFWIVSAWPAGGTAAMMTAVVCSFFAAQDDPAPAIMGFLWCTAAALVIDLVYLFAILPQVTNFEMLTLALAPTFLVLGLLIAMPATFMIGLATAVNGASMLALSDTYAANLADFVNTGLAALLGMAAAATVTSIVRSVGAEWSARHLLRASWRDIAHSAAPRATTERPAFLALLLDRIADLVPRLAAADPHADHAVSGVLVDLRVGLNIVGLQENLDDLPPDAREDVDAMLGGVSDYYARQAPEPPDVRLRARIDRAIAAVASARTERLPKLIMNLVGIRRGLFPAAPPYVATDAAIGPAVEPVG